MKKCILALTVAVVALLGVFAFGCKKSDSEIVGKYYLVSVTADNGTVSKFYAYDDGNPAVTKNSFVLEIKDNYKWNMSIMLPGIVETEDGTWEEEDGAFNLKEDRDDPVIPVTYMDGTITFNMAEDGYILSVILAKNI